MAAKNAKLPGHKWVTIDQAVGYFFYQCSVCRATVRNGEPLTKPYDEECKRK